MRRNELTYCKFVVADFTLASTHMQKLAALCPNDPWYGHQVLRLEEDAKVWRKKATEIEESMRSHLALV